MPYMTHMISFTSNMPPSPFNQIRNQSSPQTSLSQAPFLRLKLQSLPPINPPAPLLSTPIQPLLQILTLTNIKALQFRTAFNHSLNPHARNSHTSTNRQFFEFEEMETDAAERGVRDCGTAEGEFERGELWATEGQNLGCRV
jgi:hypothetical protein